MTTTCSDIAGMFGFGETTGLSFDPQGNILIASAPGFEVFSPGSVAQPEG